MKHNKRNRANRGEGAALVVILLIAIVVVAYFAVPTFKTWVNNLLSQVSGGSFTGFGVTIYYEDGTTEVIEPSALAISDMSVMYNGKAISKLVWDLWIKVSYTSNVSTNSVTGTITVKTDANIQLKSASVSYTTKLANNVNTKIATVEVTASELLSVCTTGYNGIGATAPLTVQMSFSDATSDSESATANSGLVVWCQPDGSITGVTVSLTPSPINI